MDPHDHLAARTARWSLSVTEVRLALRELRQELQDLGVRDDDGQALIECLRLVDSRATPTVAEVSADSADDDDGDALVIVGR
ncbi:MAG: hypothetical protein VKM34_02895 [Cyanobacteriota bacterium]|nr:hypothetical protein [Cyanobacteriota bacterium]